MTQNAQAVERRCSSPALHASHFVWDNQWSWRCPGVGLHDLPEPSAKEEPPVSEGQAGSEALNLEALAVECDEACNLYDKWAFGDGLGAPEASRVMELMDGIIHRVPALIAALEEAQRQRDAARDIAVTLEQQTAEALRIAKEAAHPPLHLDDDQRRKRYATAINAIAAVLSPADTEGETQ